MLNGSEIDMMALFQYSAIIIVTVYITTSCLLSTTEDIEFFWLFTTEQLMPIIGAMMSG